VSIGGNDEREQTLNSCWSRWTASRRTKASSSSRQPTGPDILDAALLRPVVRSPGRGCAAGPQWQAFHPQASCGRVACRRKLISMSRPPDVWLLGEDLANLVNEAALATARDGRDRVTRATSSRPTTGHPWRPPPVCVSDEDSGGCSTRRRSCSGAYFLPVPTRWRRSPSPRGRAPGGNAVLWRTIASTSLSTTSGRGLRGAGWPGGRQ